MADLNSPIGTPESKRVTDQFLPFFGLRGYSLPSIRADISARYALEVASDFLASTLRVASDIAHATDDNSAGLAVSLIEMSQIAIEGATSARFPSFYGPQGYSRPSARANSSAKNALKAASAFLASALRATSDVVQETGSGAAYEVAYQVEMCQAAVDAAASAIAREERHG